MLSASDMPPELTQPCDRSILLKVLPIHREDAWELCRVARNYGGVEVRDCWFKYTNEDAWQAALEAIHLRYGPEYVDRTTNTEA